MSAHPSLIIRRLPGLTDYQESLESMKRFNQQRQADTCDELWILEHAPVFTLGQAGLMSHLLTNPTHIPVIRSDRGGQITYHGPGQLIFYILLDLKRHQLTVRQLVNTIEEAVIQALKLFQIEAHRVEGAPGIYVDHAKISALGLRIQNGLCRHGFSINVDMDLTPFTFINPCGYEHLATTQVKEWCQDVTKEAVIKAVIIALSSLLRVEAIEHEC
ncbi:lipoyl(octanoyl) transferase LipB [Ferrovum sp. PN-J185]|uniref:lipoyl(octanoyl) transferase LipB n=1 Tax=Ferrovum sp. PN-J185 TaxID=1356306 RepID=UPI000795939D|nr:lipoyl(octanoyl) transferase LipB [Ferrovum sp. PN-J185]KXW55621.1 octanoyltransferase [Ferrovum sp. PN-J185]MCC6068876.1 lipoyl(octanoyl) transferase LipB [Ferrovum sp. PN-J185]MDE1891168.1 lipoyl(octanoyl) transferase LipB [Betaproteobacteria bacterium]MDE2056208.1 lipoyl(octanoyl) transferase LipB [Betaproteobacteria bacterium]